MLPPQAVGSSLGVGQDRLLIAITRQPGFRLREARSWFVVWVTGSVVCPQTDKYVQMSEAMSLEGQSCLFEDRHAQ